MTLRIFEFTRGPGDVIALHGWLSAAEVVELERVVASHPCRLTVDLGQLAGVDADGLHALVRLRQAGVRLAGASPFVELLLHRAAREDTGVAEPRSTEVKR